MKMIQIRMLFKIISPKNVKKLDRISIKLRPKIWTSLMKNNLRRRLRLRLRVLKNPSPRRTLKKVPEPTSKTMMKTSP